VASRKKKGTPGLTAEVATRMTPTVGAPPSEVKGVQTAKAEPEELAKVKGRSADARFTGATPRKRRPRNKT